MNLSLLVYSISILGPTLSANSRFDVFIVFYLLLGRLIGDRLKFYRFKNLLLPAVILFATIVICIFFQYLFGKISIFQGLPSLWGYGKIVLFSAFYSSEFVKIKNSISCSGEFVKFLGKIRFVTFACLFISIFMLILPDASGLINFIYRGGIENTGNTYSISRPVSVFDSVHACAYFFTLTPILLFSLFSESSHSIHPITPHALKIFNQIALICIIGLFFTSSKAGLFGVFVFYLTYYISRLFQFQFSLNLTRKVSKVLVIFLPIAITLLMLLSGKLFGLISSIYNSFDSLLAFLGRGLESEIVSDSFSGRLNHGWANAMENFYQNPLFGSVNITKFIGDGGYTELLSNYGLLGLLAVLVYILLSIRVFSSRRIRLSIFLAFLMLIIPTGLFQRKVLEVIPFYFTFSLAYSSKFK